MVSKEVVNMQVNLNKKCINCINSNNNVYFVGKKKGKTQILDISCLQFGEVIGVNVFEGPQSFGGWWNKVIINCRLFKFERYNCKGNYLKNRKAVCIYQLQRRGNGRKGENPQFLKK